MDKIVACLSPNGTRETEGTAPATRLLVASIRGVIRLERSVAGASWHLAGQTLTDRHVGALVYEPRSGKLFAGAHQDGGLWVSDDSASASWRPLTKGLDRPHIYALAAQTRKDRVVLFAGTEPAGLYRSDDLGESWRELPGIRAVRDTDKWTFPPPSRIAHLKDIAFHPSEPDTIYVCVEQGALLKSTDGGESWIELTDYSKEDDIAYRDTHRVLVHPTNPRMLYMATGEGLYGSTDAGAHWTHLTTPSQRIGYPDFLFFDPADTGTLFMGGAARSPRYWRDGPSEAAVARSTDGGRNWVELDKGLPNPMVGNFGAMGLHAWPGGLMLTLGTATGEIYASEDKGASWTKIAEGVAPVSKDGHYRMFQPRAAQASDGGARA